MHPQPTTNPRLSSTRLRLLAAALVCAVAGGCAALAKDQAGAQGSDPSTSEEGSGSAASARRVEPLPKQELTGKILYQIMVAEIAAQRGEVRLASSAYLDLAKTTRDPRIARRAAELAHFARQNESALEAVQLWIEADAGSAQAHYMLLGLLAQAGRFGEVQAEAVKILDIERNDQGGALLRIGRLVLRTADHARASATVDRITDPYLKLPEARMLRAQASSVAGDTARAVAEADTALALRPEWEQALLFKVQIQQRDDPEKALESMRRYLAKHPQARDLRLQFARTLVGEKRYTEARSEFQKLLLDFPDNREVLFAVGALSYQLKDYALAQSSFGKLTDEDFAEADAARLYMGQIAETQKRFPEAIAWYGSVRPGEQYIAAQVRQAQVLAQQGKVEDARKHLRAIASANPRDRVQLVLAEGQILRDGGRHKEALEVLDKGLAAEPNQPDLLYDAALVAEKLGRMDLLETHLRRLIQVKPDHAHAYNALGYSLAERNERLAEAETLVAKALQLSPDDAFIMDSMGWVLYRKGDLKGAVGFLERAYRNRADPEIAAHLGEVQWMIGQRDAATRTWREAEKANPDNEVLSAVIKRFLH
ncbi:MAG: tetratricopeptide repeat protein [Rhodocyclaceae bacterium]